MIVHEEGRSGGERGGGERGEGEEGTVGCELWSDSDSYHPEFWGLIPDPHSQ